MPNIEFLQSAAGDPVEVDVPDGGALIDVCDAHRAPVEFSCRAGTCGTCHIEVQAGAELLQPPDVDEESLLEALAGPPSSRLACQVVIRPGSGRVVLRALW